MTWKEIHEAKKNLPGLKADVGIVPVGSTAYFWALRKYLEAVITVKGHAWCMDVAEERQAMAKLVTSAISGLS